MLSPGASPSQVVPRRDRAECHLIVESDPKHSEVELMVLRPLLPKIRRAYFDKLSSGPARPRRFRYVQRRSDSLRVQRTNLR